MDLRDPGFEMDGQFGHICSILQGLTGRHVVGEHGVHCWCGTDKLQLVVHTSLSLVEKEFWCEFFGNDSIGAQINIEDLSHHLGHASVAITSQN